MPSEFEVVTNNCEIVSQVLDAGIASYVAERVAQLDFQYTCIEILDQSLTTWQIFLAIYVVALIPAIIGWAVLYIKGEPTDKLLKLGFLSFMMPLFGPLLALIPLDEHSGFISKLAVARKTSRQGNQHADNAN